MPESGQTLSHYRLIEKIGEGGMGVVWSAEDTVLGRTVALKLLPESYFSDPHRLDRFTREARLLASLNHPNIASIHGLEEDAGERFLVLEYVPGMSLAERLGLGSLAIDEVLTICCEIARALESAHANGVIHRDLKPGNVQLTPTGHVKVLDFGLAKTFYPPTSTGDDSPQSTLTMATTEHTIVGTTPYMSPEQASAKPLDKRTDIWSFGCILYELLTRRRAFAGDTTSSTLAAIHGQDPDWQRLPASTPIKVRDLLRRCLAKDPDQRLHDIADARVLIQGAQSLPEVEAFAEPSRASFVRGVLWTVACAMLITITATATWFATHAPTQERDLPSRLELRPPPGVDLVDQFAFPTVSPDGKLVVFSGRPADRTAEMQLYIRSFDSLETRLLPGTENAWEPFFSPDGLWLGFQAGDSRLMKIPAFGGEPLPICNLLTSTRGASWGEDGTILFSIKGQRGLFRVSAEGGQPEPVATSSVEDDVYLKWPRHLPGGREALVSVFSSFRESGRKIAVLSLDSGELQELLTGGTYPQFASSGHLVYSRHGTLYAVPFDLERLAVTGNTVPVLRDVWYWPGQGRVGYSLAESGSLVYGLRAQTTATGELIRISRQGRTEPIEGTRGVHQERKSFSPDGGRLAAALQSDLESSDIWVYEMQRGSWTRLTFDEFAWDPVWSPDGEWIVYSAAQGGPLDLYRVRSDGTGEPEQLTRGGHQDFPVSFSPDGNVLSFTRVHGEFGTMDLMLLTLHGQSTAEPFLASPLNERWPAFSPDGRWVAFMAMEEPEQWEIFVLPYPGPGPKVKVSVGGGTNPVWNPEGEELFYRARRSVWAVRYDTDDGFRAHAPEKVFEVDSWTEAEGNWFFNPFQISPDGQWFVTDRVDEAATVPARIVYAPNWTDELKDKVAEAQ